VFSSHARAPRPSYSVNDRRRVVGYRCEICGKGARDLAVPPYLERVNALGERPSRWQCTKCLGENIGLSQITLNQMPLYTADINITLRKSVYPAEGSAKRIQMHRNLLIYMHERFTCSFMKAKRIAAYGRVCIRGHARAIYHLSSLHSHSHYSIF
jgi:hypothetical protein